MPIRLIFADSQPTMMQEFGGLAMSGLSLLGSLFVLVVGLAVLAVIIMYVIDITQSRSAIRRNYPVIGRFRTLFSHLGEFFRCLLYTSPSPRDLSTSRMPSSA